MKAFLALAVLLTGCVTEPDEPVTYGRVSKPHKVEYIKVRAPKRAAQDTTTAPAL